MFLHDFRTPGAKFLFWIVRRGDRIGHEFHHCPWDVRNTPLFSSVLFRLSFSEMGVAETQAQSPLLRILTSVKTTFACHACESSCIGLLARSPSRIARRKGDPLSGVSTGLASAIIATTNAILAVNGAHIFIGSKLSCACDFNLKQSSDGRRFVVRADEKLTAFIELESAVRATQSIFLRVNRTVFPLAV